MAFVIVSEAYRAPSYTELTVCENAVSMSGEGFHITDPAGQVLFKMDGHALSIRDRCTLRDREGRPILSARKKLISMHERWEVCRGEDFNDADMLFTVKKSSMVQFKTHLVVFLKGNEDESSPDYEVKGNFLDREGQVFHKDQLVAELKRKFTAGNVMLDKHTFVVGVLPNVDQAFIATLVIIMDRIKED